MAVQPSEFERFVRAAHRRWVAWRALERAGVGVACASAVAFPLVAILWFRGESALPMVGALLALGAFLGLTSGIIRRPTPLDTAMEADRQFGLHDLLGTALLLTRCQYADDPARATVRTMADERCRTLGASGLVLRRLGARAWGGIGLATALVLTMSLMTVAPTPSRADRRADASERLGPAERRPATSDRLVQPVTPDRRAPRSAADSGPGNSEDAYGPDDSGERDGKQGASSDAANPTGDGAGGTAAARSDQSVTRPPSQLPSSNRADDGSSGAPAGGAGSTSNGLRRGSDAAPGGASDSAARRTPPWESSTWPTDREAALRAVERGAVPEQYRDLVRAYFDRER